MGTVNFKKIMMATDGSACSRMAIEKGIEFASLSGGTVYAVYVVPTVHLFSMDRNYSYSVDMNPYWDSMSENMYKSLKIDGEHAVNEIKEMGERIRVNVETILLEGNPSEELIRYAEEEKMDIVIMGTLGKTGLDKFLLGSVAGNLVRHSKVPVMVVRDKCKS